MAESPARISKFQFYDWLRSPLRAMSGYDDAVAWTLPQRKLEEECVAQYQQRTQERRVSNYNRPWATGTKETAAQQMSLDPEARCDEMWSLYAEKLKILACRLEHEHAVDGETLPPKPPYRQNATTRWGLAPSLVPLDMPMPEVTKSKEKRAPSKPKAPSKSKPSKKSSKRSKEPTEVKTEVKADVKEVKADVKAEGEGEVGGSRTASKEPEAKNEGPTGRAVPIPVVQISETETSSATDSLEEKVEPVVEEPTYVQPEEGRFSEEDFLKMYTFETKKKRRPPNISGRPQSTMWMSSSMGGSTGLGPDIVELMRRNSLLRAAFEKMNMNSLPELYRNPQDRPRSSAERRPQRPLLLRPSSVGGARPKKGRQEKRR